MRTTRTHLADGRELIYFDEDGTEPPRDSVDERLLPPSIQDAGEIRHDPITGSWVAIADHRQGRTHLPSVDECPLCPSAPNRHTEIPASDYQVVAFENRFPSFVGSRASEPHAGHGPTDLLARRAAVGRCEVVCFTADHRGSFVELPPARARMIIDVWAHRSAELLSLDGVEQVFCFENRGEDVGVTLHHPHGQIYAYPFVTPHTRQLLGRAEEHHDRTGRDLFDDVLEAELDQAVRVVVSGEHWTAFVPHASFWPVELQLYPHRHVSGFTDLRDGERDELAVIYQDLLRRIESAFGDAIPYIAAWHQAPRHERALTRLHLRLFSNRRGPGKLKHLAGSEVAMGAFINDLLPENVAGALRDAPGVTR
jgi:UDPglucose--hexose-1-phosphate uridylyltransferase